ncbi:MAG: SDR family oxidoreductase [Deltaproteobacteria bacterium]|nr:SDR family oxidoreductase [Deltaproteobacteria bacterium]
MKIVVVTGGSRGIGQAVARELARRGIAVVLTFVRHAEDAEAVVRAIEAEGGRAAALPLDVTAVSSFAAFRQRLLAVLHAWGRDTFDGLVNNGGYGLFRTIDAVTEAEFDGLAAVHLKGPFFLAQTLLPLLARGAQVVNVTSATTRVATIGVAPYAALKAGLEVLTRYQAKEWGERGIRANAVSPGAIRTELGGGLTPEFEALLGQQTALGRVGEPDEVARVIAALLGDDLGWVNGQCIDVSGGYAL